MGTSSSAEAAGGNGAAEARPQRTTLSELPLSSNPPPSGAYRSPLAHPVRVPEEAEEEEEELELEEEDSGASSVSSVFTMCNSAIGAGVLSLPYAFRCAGAGRVMTSRPAGQYLQDHTCVSMSHRSCRALCLCCACARNNSTGLSAAVLLCRRAGVPLDMCFPGHRPGPHAVHPVQVCRALSSEELQCAGAHHPQTDHCFNCMPCTTSGQANRTQMNCPPDHPFFFRR